MSTQISEKRLVDVLMAHIRETGQALREVPHYEKRIDIVAFPNGTDEVWAIEAKVSNWSRAIQQARVNLSAADRSFVAIYSKYAHRVSRETLNELGIGLIAVGSRWGDVNVLYQPKKSPYVNRLVTDRLRANRPRR